MPPFSSQKQQPLYVALAVIVLLIAGIIYKTYFQQAPEVVAPTEFSALAPAVVPQIPQDLLQSDIFLKLQTYQPVVAPEPSLRPNPFAAP